MTVEQYIESAKTLESIAKKYLGDYANFYYLERYDSGNIEFSIPNFKIQEVLEKVPDDTNNFITNIQFCYCNGEWSPCMYSRIQNVGNYKKCKGWSKNEQSYRVSVFNC